MADIIRVQPTTAIPKVQNQTYRVQGSDGAEDHRRQHEEQEAPHDKLELHDEIVESETPPETLNPPTSSEDNGLDIAV
ncbi:MAG: hypothetical protein KF784_13610 [Fimbriimonadaceae bacterium]|nr:hypothetical protein [Fimbriimonadaceae bacterium]